MANDGAAVLEVEARLKDFISANLSVIESNMKKFGNTVEQTSKKSVENTNKMSSAMEAFGKIAVAGAVIGGMKNFIEVAEESSRANAQIKQTMSNVGDSYEKYKAQIEDVTKALQNKTNYENDDQVAALDRLITMTGSYSTAIALLPSTLDLATKAHVDVGQAASTMGKFVMGNTMAMKKLLPELKDMKTEGKSAAEMLGYVQDRIKGAAEVDVSQLEQFRMVMKDVSEGIGNMLLPFLTDLVRQLKIMPMWFKEAAVGAMSLIAAIRLLGLTWKGTGVGLIISAIVYGALKVNEAYEDLKIGSEKYAQSVTTYNEASMNMIRVEELIQIQKKKNEEYSRAHNSSAGNWDAVKAADMANSLQELQRAYQAYKGTTDQIENDMKKGVVFGGGQAEGDTAAKAKHDAWMKEREMLFKINRESGDLREKMRQADIDLKAKQTDEEFAALETKEEKRKQIMENSIAAQAQLAESLGMALTAGIGKGQEAFKEVGKAVLTTMLSFIEKQLVAAQIDAAIKAAISWNPAPLLAIAGITGVFEAAKAGIASFALGTRNAPGGMAWVGEQGPELINVPSGARVYNHTESKQLTQNGGNKTVNMNLTTISKRDLKDMLVEMNREGYLLDLKAEWAM